MKRLPWLIMLLALPAGATTYYTNGAHGSASDSNACTDTALPCLTVAGGIGKMSGSDELVIYSGTYNECVTLPHNKDGTAGSPTIIRGQTGTATDVVIDGDAATCALFTGTCQVLGSGHYAALTLGSSYSSNLNYVRIKDLAVVPPIDGSRGYGIHVGCSENIELLNIASTYQPAETMPSTSNTGNAVIGLASTTDVLIKDFAFSRTAGDADGFHVLVGTNADDTFLVDGSADSFAGGFTCFSSASNGLYIDSVTLNDIESDCDGNNVVQAYNSDNIRMSYSRVTDSANYVMRIRSYLWGSLFPKIVLTNNTFEGRGSGVAIDVGYSADQDAMHGLFARNNVFENYTTAFQFGEEGILGCNIDLGYNAYITVTNQVVDNDTDCTITAGSNNVTTGITLDGSGCPGVSDNAVDAGDPDYPIPTDGGATVDIGWCEEAAAGVPPYTMQVIATTDDPTPQITWDGGVGGQVNLTNLDFVTILDGAAQTTYEVHIDAASTFNTGGPGTPSVTSGVVSSSTQSYTPGTLADGTYYVRVRINGEMWSYPERFTIDTTEAAVTRRMVICQ